MKRHFGTIVPGPPRICSARVKRVVVRPGNLLEYLTLPQRQLPFSFAAITEPSSHVCDNSPSLTILTLAMYFISEFLHG